MKRLLALVVALACLGNSAWAEKDHHPTPYRGSDQLQKMKQLAGFWEADSLGPNGKKETVIYKITSGGSALQEILFPGTQHEMVSVYHDDDSDLVMTHYCALGNQPLLKADSKSSSKQLNFSFVSAGNMRSEADHHMRSLTIDFISKDKIRQEWVSYADGKKAMTKILNLERKG